MSEHVRGRVVGVMAALVVALTMALPTYAGTINGLPEESRPAALNSQPDRFRCDVSCASDAAAGLTPVSDDFKAGDHFSIDTTSDSGRGPVALRAEPDSRANPVKKRDPLPDSVHVVPEPGSSMLMATALVLAGGLGLLRLRSA